MSSREQLKYAMGRLQEIYNEKRSLIAEECMIKGSRIKIKDVEAAIKSGTLKARKDIEEEAYVNNYTDLAAVFDVSKYLRGDRYDSAKMEKREKALKGEFTRINDQLMLGDLKVAMSLVEAFSKAKF